MGWQDDAVVGNSWQKDEVVSEPSRGKAALAGVNKGIAGLVGLPVDTAENIVNLGIAGVGSIANAAGRPDLAPNLVQGTLGGSQSISGLMNKVGIGTDNPNPKDTPSRLLHTGGTIVGSSLVPGARPVPTAAAATGGAIASETLGPEYTGVGAMVPAAATQAVQAGTTALANRMQPRMEAFQQAGTKPSVGQATEFNFIQGFENLLSKFPGGQGIFRKFSENQQKQLGDTAKTGVSAEDAGRAIEKGVTGEGGFVSRFKATQDKLYDKLDAFIPNGTPIEVSRTRTVLGELNADIPGAPNLSQWFKNSKIQGIEGALKADTSGLAAAEQSMNPFQLGMLKTLPLAEAERKAIFSAFDQGQLPYEAVKKLRTLVGREVADSTIASSVPKSKWKALYAALSDDLGVAAQGRGPQAEKSWKMANDYSRAGMDRIETILDRVVGKTPEETFAKFMPKDADQATTVRATMRSLDPEQRQVVQDAVVNRLGRATPGKQNEAGDVFSPETFLTNWNKLSPGAKQQLFNDPAMRKNMDALAGVSENLRSGAKVFANPSGTAGAAAPMGIGYLVARGVVSGVTGDLGGAAYHLGTAGALMGGASIGAKMLTSPKVVEWLAQAPKVAPEAGAMHLARLGVIYNATKDPQLKEELGSFIQSVQK